RGAATPHEPRDTSTWFHRPTWRELPPVAAGIRALGGRRILVFDEETGLGAAVAGGLAAVGAIPVLVTRGEAFARTSPRAFSIDPTQQDGYRHLAADMCAGDSRLAGIVDCWSAAPPGSTDLEAAGVTTLLHPMRLAHALGGQQTVRPLPMLLVARGSARVHQDDHIDP